jgi:hypothetical protein
MWRLIVLVACLAAFGCSVHQPESSKTVSAFEVPLLSEDERNQFLDLLRREAKAEGLHVDAESKQELQDRARAIPEATMTIHAAIWRGSEDDQLEASVMDLGTLGRAWISFSRGRDPALATRFRERLMSQIVKRWPDTRRLPIMPTGAIPLHDDLLLTRDGYRVKRDAASKYELSPSSPLVAQN